MYRRFSGTDRLTAINKQLGVRAVASASQSGRWSLGRKAINRRV